MAMYVTQLRYRKVNGALRPMRTALLYADSRSELARAEDGYNLHPVSSDLNERPPCLELDWYDYHRMLSLGALRTQLLTMATGIAVNVG